MTSKLKPGDKLPPNQELARLWSTSTFAVQQALANLTAEGLLDRRQRRGTFVRDLKERPLVGVLFGEDLIREPAGFYRALSASIKEHLERETHLLGRVYDGLTESAQADQSKDTIGRRSSERLHQDRKNYCFKGFICIGTSNVRRKDIFDDLQPRSVFEDVKRGVDILIDRAHFGEETISQLAARGFRKIAYLQVVGPGSLSSDSVSPEIQGVFDIAKRLSIPKPVIHKIELPSTARSIEREFHRLLEPLFAKGGGLVKKNGPEVIIVPDDILARPVILKLLKHGIRIPEDVKICVQTNECVDICYGVPVYRYEISVHEIARNLVGLLHSRMANNQGQEVPVMIRGKFLDLD